MTTPARPTYLTLSEAARRLDRSVYSVKLYEKSGRLPALRTATGLRLFDQRDVDAFARTLPARKGGPRR